MEPKHKLTEKGKFSYWSVASQMPRGSLGTQNRETLLCRREEKRYKGNSISQGAPNECSTRINKVNKNKERELI